jgi:hypothetical protein
MTETIEYALDFSTSDSKAVELTIDEITETDNIGEDRVLEVAIQNTIEGGGVSERIYR